MKYIGINKNKKIVLIIIISIITLIIAYYAYTSKANEEFSIEGQELGLEENKLKEENETNKDNQEENETKNKIIIHVSGAVKNEGIVELDEKARVADAIEKAGGVTENAYMKDVNLAQSLEDGMKIYIPTKEEIEKGMESEIITGTENQQKNNNYNKKIITGGSASSSNNSNNNDNSSNSNNNIKGKININTANIEELDTLPGIGQATANKIISYRQEHGKFKTIEEIKEVSGIGDSKYEKIKDLIEI